MTEGSLLTGYAHPGYAASLIEFGAPRRLTGCGGWLLVRPIPGLPDCDAMGCYPLFVCQDWLRLAEDVAELDEQLVALALVTDPFGAYNESLLRAAFGDVVFPFKEHFIVDLTQPAARAISKHHRYYASRALTKLEIDVCCQPTDLIDEWCALYQTLMARHGLTGIKTFSRRAFVQQLSLPGIVMLRARAQNKTVGAHLWYVQDEVAYSHLAASSPEGYSLMAAYALHWYAIQYFRGKVRWLHLGAGAGVNGAAKDGLTRFKQGWSTGTRTAYFCGRILAPQRYAELVQSRTCAPTPYFPAYRNGEMG